NRNYKFLILLSLVLLIPIRGEACDPCSLYNSARLQGNQANRWSLSISEQYTDFDKAEGLSEESPRNGELTRSFTNTQLSVGYDLFNWLGVQATVPIVYRSYDRTENYRTKTDSETGIGDVVLSANVTPYCIYEPDLT